MNHRPHSTQSRPLLQRWPALFATATLGAAFLTGPAGAAMAATASYTNTASVVMGNMGDPLDVAVDATVDTVYVANAATHDVDVMDGSDYTHFASIPVGSAPTSVAVDPGSQQVYVANSQDNTVSIIDGVSRTVVATVAVGAAPTSLAVDTGTRTVYVGNRDGKSLSVINAATRAVTTIALPSAPQDVAVDSGTHTVYVTHQASNSLSVIDGTTRARTSVQVGAGPTGVAVDQNTHAVYVANSTAKTLSVLQSGKVIATLPTGAGVAGIGVDSATHAVYVPAPGSETMSVFDGTALSAPPAIVTGGPGDLAVAISPVTHRAYVGDQTFGMVGVVDSSVPTVVGSESVKTEFHTTLHGTISRDDVVVAVAVVKARVPGAHVPRGWVQFYDGNQKVGAPMEISGGSASYFYTQLTPGKHTLQAKYLGSYRFAASFTPARTLTVVP